MDNISITYYGPIENYDEQAYGHRIIIDIYGFDKGTLDFCSSNDTFRWEVEYTDGKTTSDFVHVLIGVHHMSLIQKMDVFATEFIPETEVFAGKWGPEMVSVDLCFSINDVCINIGRPLISWPPIHYIDETGTIQTPNITDYSGHLLDLILRKF